MSEPDTPTPDVQRQVETLADWFLDQLLAGKSPDRSSLIAAHPECAELLDKRLAALELAHRLRPELEADADGPPAPHPRRVGRYRIRQALGEGASAAVYRAYDPRLGREVALKVLHADRKAGPEARERFRRDARIAAQLWHPHIVPIHEIGERGDDLYIDMELVPGETLESRLQRGRFDFRPAAELVKKLALALDYAHGLGIVHRDVKPSNILLDADGEPKLTDFGLARRQTGEASITHDGQIVGTPFYMSPEQARGDAHAADRRSDVYSLGVVFYRLLTGRTPFEGSDATALLVQVLQNEPPAPRKLDPVIPPDLELICQKAMAKEREQRFATAADFAEELDRWLRHEPLRIRRPTAWERGRSWSRRNRLAATIGAVAAVLLVAVSAVLGGIAWRARENAIATRMEAAAERERLAADREQKLAAMQIPVLVERALQRLQGPTQGRRWESQKILKGVAKPRKLLPPGEERELLDLQARSAFAATLAAPDLEVDQRTGLPFSWARVWPATLHPDGQAMVIGTPSGPARWDYGQPLKLPEGIDKDKPRPQLMYGPDGKYLAFAPAEGGLQLWNETATAKLMDLGPPDSSTVLTVGFDLRGSALWACYEDGWVRRWSLPDGKPYLQWQIVPSASNAVPRRFTAARFNQEATLLAVGDATGRVRFFESSGNSVGNVVSLQPLAIHALAWSPDNSLVAFGTKGGDVQVWRVKEARPEHQFPGSSAETSSIVFSPDGHWLLAGNRGQPFKMWDADTGEQILTGHQTAWGFSRDGRRLAVTSKGEASFCTLSYPQALRHFSGHRVGIEHLAWARDNRHLVSLDRGFQVRVWDRTRPLALHVFQAPPGGFYPDHAAVAISDNGELVAYASGGEESHAFIRDTSTQTDLHRWELGQGIEKLAYAGSGQFYLIREEPEEPGKPVYRTAVYELSVGQPIKLVRVLRRSEPGDRHGFLYSDLSWDGQVYLWVGPRDPVQKRRAEVYDVSTGRQLERLRIRPGNREDRYAIILLGGDARHLWVTEPEGKGSLLYDMNDPTRAVRYSRYPKASTSDGRWHVTAPDREREASTFAIRSGPDQPAWLEFTSVNQGNYGPSCFTADGTYLAWGSESGAIWVADLEAVRQQVEEFAKEALPE